VATGRGARPDVIAPAGTRIGLAVARFNEDITTQLRFGAVGALEGRVDSFSEIWVPGAFELPLVAQHLLAAGCDAVVALGCVIRGDTGHYDFVAGECASGLQRVQLDTGKPVVFGVLTTDTLDQALDRSMPEPGAHNVGAEGAAVAVEMVAVLRAATA